MKVLVVDDMPAMRSILITMLRKLRFEDVLEAKNGDEALDLIAGGDVGLVLSDWNMPGMSGVELLRRIRGRDAGKELPFVLISAEKDNKRVIEAITAGASNYLVKPFTPNSLRNKIFSALRRHRNSI